MTNKNFLNYIFFSLILILSYFLMFGIGEKTIENEFLWEMFNFDSYSKVILISSLFGLSTLKYIGKKTLIQFVILLFLAMTSEIILACFLLLSLEMVSIKIDRGKRYSLVGIVMIITFSSIVISLSVQGDIKIFKEFVNIAYLKNNFIRSGLFILILSRILLHFTFLIRERSFGKNDVQLYGYLLLLYNFVLRPDESLSFFLSYFILLFMMIIGYLGVCQYKEKYSRKFLQINIVCSLLVLYINQREIEALVFIPILLSASNVVSEFSDFLSELITCSFSRFDSLLLYLVPSLIVSPFIVLYVYALSFKWELGIILNTCFILVFLQQLTLLFKSYSTSKREKTSNIETIGRYLAYIFFIFSLICGKAVSMNVLTISEMKGRFLFEKWEFPFGQDFILYTLFIALMIIGCSILNYKYGVDFLKGLLSSFFHRLRYEIREKKKSCFKEYNVKPSDKEGLIFFDTVNLKLIVSILFLLLTLIVMV